MLDVYQLAIRWLTRAKIHVDRTPRGLRREAVQLISASNSIVRNISEGVGRVGSAWANHYQIARGGAGECASSLDFCLSWGWSQDEEVLADRALLSRFVCILYRLSNRLGVGGGTRAISWEPTLVDVGLPGASPSCRSTSTYLVLRAACRSTSTYLVLRAAAGRRRKYLALVFGGDAGSAVDGT